MGDHGLVAQVKQQQIESESQKTWGESEQGGDVVNGGKLEIQDKREEWEVLRKRKEGGKIIKVLGSGKEGRESVRGQDGKWRRKRNSGGLEIVINGAIRQTKRNIGVKEKTGRNL